MKNFVSLFILVSSVFLITACATPQKAEEPKTMVFYPEPPDPPRLQFLASYTTASDLKPEKSSFEAFVTGEKDVEKRLDKPYGVAMYDGKIYVCDTNHTVMIFDLQKKTFAPIQGAKGMGKLLQPLNIAIDQDGTKYVTDVVRGQIVVFDKNDFYVTAFGQPGFWKPVDTAIFGDELYVADTKNASIIVLDKKTGNTLRKFGQTGDAAERLYIPTNVAFDKDGILYVSDSGKFEVLKFDRDGHMRGSFGKLGTSTGTFARPRGITTDRDKHVYVVDAAFDNVQVFNDAGQMLFFFGKAGRGPGDLYLPAQVSIDYKDVQYFSQFADPNFEIEYLVFVTSQFGNRMVNVYGFGKAKGVQYPTDEELKAQFLERVRKLEEERKKQQPKTEEETQGQENKNGIEVEKLGQ